jgi:hypothetical protein
MVSLRTAEKFGQTITLLPTYGHHLPPDLQYHVLQLMTVAIIVVMFGLMGELGIVRNKDDVSRLGYETEKDWAPSRLRCIMCRWSPFTSASDKKPEKELPKWTRKTKMERKDDLPVEIG